MKIGIPTNLRDKRFGTHGNYIEWVSQFGKPILLTPHVDQFDQIDALFLPGGKDVQFNLTFLNNPSDPHLEWFDRFYIPRFIEAKKPIFAICRGMQALNVYFSGTLRNLYGEELKLHNQCETEDVKNSLVHKVYEPTSEDEDDYHLVNSIHHQAIDKLGNGLEVIAKCDNVIEAIKHEELPIVGVQWHAEKINDEFSKKLVKSIL